MSKETDPFYNVRTGEVAEFPAWVERLHNPELNPSPEHEWVALSEVAPVVRSLLRRVTDLERRLAAIEQRPEHWLG